MKRTLLYAAVIGIGSCLGLFFLQDITMLKFIIWLVACWAFGHVFHEIDKHLHLNQ